MRKLTPVALASLTVFALAACKAHPAPATGPQPVAAPPGSATGGADARSAVLAFLNAGKAQDLQALSAVWGTSEGSARSNNNMSRDEMEKRELIMMCYLDHETHQVLSDAPSANNERVVAVQLRRGLLTRTANFQAVPGPGGRWYVRAFDMEALTDFCRSKGRG